MSWATSKIGRGDQTLRDTENKIRGYYDAKGDYTRDADQNIVAKKATSCDR